ncbi:VWA domain-containing protein [Allochromatium vinosum]|uniref:von Willebrand factor type A n=1 Tax=Allochromatium vinosum (strain ATCC 17899 / DSM 180 / NBRC 103801 / NCIMB 10441 / D) TaxID=572477 RepID=D3RWF9_ALLVD|nr:VWA domain-containing protein [Allochromatium vinosum]ADC64171.1 von Willebrand factor type A [Allochromatium vinosum DSM 180]
MSLHTLTRALPIVAAAYGRRFGIPVQVGGDQAHTDGRMIQIPTLADTAQAHTLAFGYLAHEAGHVRLTDFNHPRHPTALGRCIENILEDVRIEQAMIRDYPGTRQTLDTVVETLIAQGRLSPVTPNNTPSEILVNGLLALSRARYRRQSALTRHAQTADQVMRQVFGSRFVPRLHGLLTEIPTLTSTAETIALAQRIIALIEQESQEPEDSGTSTAADTGEGEPPESRPGCGTDRDDPSSRAEAEADSPTSQDTESDPQDATGTGAEDQDRIEATEHTTNPRRQSTSNTDTDPASVDTTAGRQTTPSSTDLVSSAMQDALQSTLEAGEHQLPEDLFQTVAETLGAQSVYAPTLLPTMERFRGEPHPGQSALQRAKIHSAKLTARLHALVEAQTLEQTQITPRGRALSSTHLHRAGVGNPRIFRLRDHKTAPNTALHLLIDLSGSMAGGQDVLALDAALALALALEPIKGVSCAVSAFPGIEGQEDRITGLLGHGERVATRAGAFVQRGRGGTPMTGALWFAAADLLGRPEARKVILTLTDGVPNDIDSTRDLIRQATAAGLQMLGVGIEVDVSRVFPHAIRINDIADLKRELFHITEHLLLA